MSLAWLEEYLVLCKNLVEEKKSSTMVSFVKYLVSAKADSVRKDFLSFTFADPPSGALKNHRENISGDSVRFRSCILYNRLISIALVFLHGGDILRVQSVDTTRNLRPPASRSCNE